MSLIKNLKSYTAIGPQKHRVLLLCGFGGSIWQTRRLTNVLRRAGYAVSALDFPETIFSGGDPELLPNLVDEVLEFAENFRAKAKDPVLLFGISLGSLISLNIMRRSKNFDRAVMITGGDIVKVAQNIYGRKIWPQTYEELAKTWRHVNMYSATSELKGKSLLFVLPSNDNLIDADDVRAEVTKQQKAGNDLTLTERPHFGHVGTIVEETILFPRRALGYISQLPLR